jgi:hypothetical protein
MDGICSPQRNVRKEYIIFVEKPEKRLVGKSRHRCEVIKLNHKERECEGVYGFEQTQDRVQSRVLVKTVMKVRGGEGDFLTLWANISVIE